MKNIWKVLSKKENNITMRDIVFITAFVTFLALLVNTIIFAFIGDSEIAATGAAVAAFSALAVATIAVIAVVAVAVVVSVVATVAVVAIVAGAGTVTVVVASIGVAIVVATGAGAITTLETLKNTNKIKWYRLCCVFVLQAISLVLSFTILTPFVCIGVMALCALLMIEYSIRQ